ncbi:sensor histidine kinase [Thermanaerovibrio acidaminovorans]|uniref:sensor histidine kinase n=1 Tax=Thermanaerovibrio acidaminovorans TaxID=81462 RepID=UPI0024902852|nr:ATP-binding protein [Thermanaerovibrio acidaminovorans]
MLRSIRGQVALLLALPLVTLVALWWIFALRDTRGHLEDETRSNLSALSASAGALVRLSGTEPESLDRVLGHWASDTGVRCTVIDRDGRVLWDSQVPLEGLPSLENHLTRPEVRRAFEAGEGYSVRRSDTTGVEYLYEARRVELPGGATVVRVSLERNRFEGVLSSLRMRLLTTLGAALLLALGVGTWWMRRITGPILELARTADRAEAGEDIPLPPGGANEVRLLGLSIRRMARRLNRAMEDLEEERRTLKGLVETMPVGVLMVDRQRRVLYCNAPMGDLLRDMARPGTPLEGAVRHPKLMDAVDQLLKGGQVEATLTQSDAWSERHYLMRGVGVQGSAVVTIQDITQRVRGEEALRRFVSDVGHEFQTPLTVIRGAAELLRDYALGDNLRLIDRILEQQRRLTDMVDRMLLLTRFEGGDLGEPRELDLADLVRRAAEDASWLARDGEVQVELSLPHEAPVRASAEMEAAVRNLIENAVKYVRSKFDRSPGGLVKVTLEDQGDRYSLWVEDNGPGVPHGMEEQIFQRFRRGDQHRSRSSEPVGGYGLGLSIARGIARAHGGDVRLEWSQPGVGSRFLLWVSKGLDKK